MAGGQPPHLGDPIRTELWWWCSSTAFAASHTCLVFLSPLCWPSSRHLLSPHRSGWERPHRDSASRHQQHLHALSRPPSSEWRSSESELCIKTCSDRWLYLSFVSFDVDADHVYKLRVSKCGCFLRDSQESSDTLFSSKKSHVNVIVPYTLTSFYEPSDLFDIMNPIYCFNFFFFLVLFLKINIGQVVGLQWWSHADQSSGIIVFSHAL